MADLTRVAEVPDLETSIYDVLMSHQRAHGRDLGNGTHTAVCTCGLVVVLDWKLDAKSWFVGHQAQMLADAGLVATETEWGHVADGYLVEEGASEEGARRGGADDDRFFPSLGTWPARVVRREVTPWRAADEGGEA